MANVFQAATGYRDPAKAMTLKALEARAKAAQDAVAQSMQPTVVADPLQGVAGLLSTLGSQMQEGRADRAVAQGRGELARLQAGITDYSKIDPNTLAQIGTLDPEAQRFLQERMLEIQNREDEQGFRAGESQLERDQRQALQTQQQDFTGGQNALQRASSEGIATAGNQSAEEIAAANRAATTTTANLNRAATVDTANADRTSREKVNQADIDARVVELPKQLAAIDKMVANREITPEEGEAAKNKLTAAGGMTLSTTTDSEGNTTTTYDTTGKAGGGQDAKNVSNAIESYRARAQAGNDMLVTVDMMRKAGGQSGYAGPGGRAVGWFDDALEAVTTQFLDKDISLPGSSGARALLRGGALSFVQDAITKTKGSISEAENKLFASTAPTLEQTDEGREFMLNYAEKIANRAVERADEAAAWAKEYGNLDGFEAEWNQYVIDNPLIALDADGKLVFASED